jgi:hypothetical protein
MGLRARSLAAALTLAALTIALAPSAEAGDAAPVADPPHKACIPPTECCRTCNQGKACGNTCISESKTCRKRHGCACNLEDMCASGPGDP